MSRSLPLSTALLTVVLACTACSGQDDGAAPPDKTASTTASTTTPTTTTSTARATAPTGSATLADTPADSPGASQSSGAASATASATVRVPATPTVTAPNTSQLRKDVTARQRRFVTRNAPPGVDAEAILQSGEDACQRMQIAAATSGRTAVTVALISGQIGNGRDAITYLCRELEPALVAADAGFPDGGYTVGSKARKGRVVAAGRYSAPQPSPTCAWSVIGADGSVAQTGSGTPQPSVVLRRGQRFSSTGCAAWLRS